MRVSSIILIVKRGIKALFQSLMRSSFFNQGSSKRLAEETVDGRYRYHSYTRPRTVLLLNHCPSVMSKSGNSKILFSSFRIAILVQINGIGIYQQNGFVVRRLFFPTISKLSIRKEPQNSMYPHLAQEDDLAQRYQMGS
jgi:hypothetical protein